MTARPEGKRDCRPLVPAGTGLAYHRARHDRDAFKYDNEIETSEAYVGNENIVSDVPAIPEAEVTGESKSYHN